MKKYFIFILLFTSGVLPAQPKTFSSVNKYEKTWALFHPFAACKIKEHQKEMYAMYNDVAASARISLEKSKPLLDTFINGGKLDAFRHTFAMAYFTKFVKAKKLRKLGIAHEKGNYLQFLHYKKEDGESPDSLSSVMDLKNNEVGLAMGAEAKKISAEELKHLVIQKINNGDAYIIKRNAKGAYLTCEGEIITPEKLRAWNIPKCLVHS